MSNYDEHVIHGQPETQLDDSSIALLPIYVSTQDLKGLGHSVWGAVVVGHISSAMFMGVYVEKLSLIVKGRSILDAINWISSTNGYPHGLCVYSDTERIIENLFTLYEGGRNSDRLISTDPVWEALQVSIKRLKGFDAKLAKSDNLWMGLTIEAVKQWGEQQKLNLGD